MSEEIFIPHNKNELYEKMIKERYLITYYGEGKRKFPLEWEKFSEKKKSKYVRI